ncbi:hypothetical protein LEP1GSC008_1277 [Leptospira kirschneri serovar Bulgarica str. Nikolaevo]|uniref:Uncharacterized protein n=1 Tax=Leptospira kirschneri serovar Bulgarica str. Nikolaevo TaxID=1240687 RepID=M6FSE8_9LEPT|nr:hypothetical protein LEP1GSC008_1277 [Leptospira kirschneri serovar Bulgarica str. Nikolaevo]
MPRWKFVSFLKETNYSKTNHINQRGVFKSSSLYNRVYQSNTT